jgi:hypothetical protein
MTNNLVVGDLHTKFDTLEKVISYLDDHLTIERIIFLGDYVDDWNKAPEASYNLLTRLIAFKKAYPNKVVLLLGNHDFSEWMGGKFKCSGFNPVIHTIVKPLFDENEDLFQLAFSDRKYLYTHAGITSSWVKDIQLIDDLYLPLNSNKSDEWADYLNWVFKERNNDLTAHKIFNTLSQVGGYRGGFESPSPIWADKQELLARPLKNISQIVGHTPVKTTTVHLVRNTGKNSLELIFCDTLSTYSDGNPYGDGSFLLTNKESYEFRRF